MKKIYIVALALILLVGGYFVYRTWSADSYVSNIGTEVAALEESLAGLDEALMKGELSPEEVIALQETVIAQIITIRETTENAGAKGGLTDTQSQELQEGLNRLVGALVNHRDDLVKLDSHAAIAIALQPELNPRGTRSATRHLALAFDAFDEQSNELGLEFVDGVYDVLKFTLDEVKEAQDAAELLEAAAASSTEAGQDYIEFSEAEASTSAEGTADSAPEDTTAN